MRPCGVTVGLLPELELPPQADRRTHRAIGAMIRMYMLLIFLSSGSIHRMFAAAIGDGVKIHHMNMLIQNKPLVRASNAGLYSDLQNR